MCPRIRCGDSERGRIRRSFGRQLNEFGVLRRSCEVWHTNDRQSMTFRKTLSHQNHLEGPLVLGGLPRRAALLHQEGEASLVPSGWRSHVHRIVSGCKAGEPCGSCWASPYLRPRQRIVVPSTAAPTQVAYVFTSERLVPTFEAVAA